MHPTQQEYIRVHKFLQINYVWKCKGHCLSISILKAFQNGIQNIYTTNKVKKVFFFES